MGRSVGIQSRREGGDRAMNARGRQAHHLRIVIRGVLGARMPLRPATGKDPPLLHTAHAGKSQQPHPHGRAGGALSVASSPVSKAMGKWFVAVEGVVENEVAHRAMRLSSSEGEIYATSAPSTREINRLLARFSF
jgi:hypothetical protein